MIYAIDNPNKNNCLVVNLNFCGASSSDLINEPIKKKVVLITFKHDRKNKTKSILFRISTNIILIYLIQKFPFCIL